MHIKRLLSGSLAVMMVATSFNVPINAKAAEIPDVEPEAGLEENQELPSSDAEISLDDETNVVVEEAAEEPEVVAPKAEETPSEEPTEELVVEEETAAQDVVGVGTVDATLTVHFDGVEEAVGDVSDTVQVADTDPTTVDATVTLPAAPTKAGFIFDGWKLSKIGSDNYTGEEVKEDAGATFKYGIAANTELTFTAQWTARTRTVTFDVNGGTAKDGFDEKKNATYTYGADDAFATAASAAAELITPPEGKVFDKWATRSSEGPDYTYTAVSDLASLKPTNGEASVALTLYATFKDEEPAAPSVANLTLTNKSFRWTDEDQKGTASETLGGKFTIKNAAGTEITSNLDELTFKFVKSKTDATTPTAVKDIATYYVKVTAANNATHFVPESTQTFEVKMLPKVLTIEPLGADEADEDTAHTAIPDGDDAGKYGLYYNAKDEGTNKKGTVAQEVKPAVTITGDNTGTKLTAGTDYTVTYANNKAETTEEQKATVTIALAKTDKAKNYTFQETGADGKTDVTSVVEEFEIVDNSAETVFDPEPADSNDFDVLLSLEGYKVEKKSVLSSTPEDGLVSAYDKTTHKYITEAIPKINIDSIKLDGEETIESWPTVTLLPIRNTSKVAKTIDPETYTVKKELVDDEKGQFVITFKNSAELYTGSYTLPVEFVEDCDGNHELYIKDVTQKADFNNDGTYRYICKKCHKPAPVNTEITTASGKVTVNATNSYTIPQLNVNSVKFALSNGDPKDALNDYTEGHYYGDVDNLVIPFKGRAITADDTFIEIRDTNSTAGDVLIIKKNSVVSVANKDDKKKVEKHKNAIFKVALSNEKSASKEAKITITFTDELPEYAGAKFEKTFEISPAVDSVETPSIDANVSAKNGTYSYNKTKVSLATTTVGAKIYWTTAGIDISDLDKLDTALKGSNKDKIHLYDGNPIAITTDMDTSTNYVVFNVIAVKNKGYATNSKAFSMLAANLDKGDVNDIGHKDLGTYDSEGNWTPISDYSVLADKGLWISMETMAEIDHATYDGYAKKVTEKNSSGTWLPRVFYGNQLLKASDYTIKYKNNVNAWLADGTYPVAKAPTITITGKGEFAGGYSQIFEIQPVDIGETNTTRYYSGDTYPWVQFSSTALLVAEKATIQKPKFTGKRFDELKSYSAKKDVFVNLSEGKDFTVDYSEVKSEANTAKTASDPTYQGYPITISGEGNYKGTVTRYLKVSPVGLFLNNATVTFDTKGVVFDGTDQSKNVKTTVKLGDYELTEGVDYSVSYSHILSPYNYLTSTSGLAYYGGVDDTDPLNPVYVSSNKDELYSPGKYYVTISPMGSFQGSYNKQLTISNNTAKAISKTSISGIKKEAKYADGGVFKDIQVTDGGVLLKEGTDYLVGYSFSAGKATIGNAKVTVYGIGKYSGYKTFSYKITGVDVKDKSVIIEYNKSVEYDGTQKDYYEVGSNNINLVVKYQPDSQVPAETLIAGRDYYIAEYQKTKLPDYKNAGTNKTFTIVGKGRFTGKIAEKFTITPFDVDADQAKFSSPTATDPTPTNSNTLTFSYQDNETWNSTAKAVEYQTVGYTGAAMQPGIGGTVISNATNGMAAAQSNSFIKANFGFKYTNGYKTAGQTVTVTVTPKKNFKGKPVTMKYVVGNYSINNTSITINDKVQGKWSDPKPSVKNGKTALKVNKDYKVSYYYAKATKVTVGTGKNAVEETRAQFTAIDPKTCKDIIPAGTEIIARFTGIGNYEDERELSYRYVATKKDISKASVKVLGTYIYDGTNIKLDKKDIQVVLNKETLKASDFEILDSTYEYPAAGVGTVKVTLHGIGDFGGYKVATFKIDKASMNYMVEFKVDTAAAEKAGLTVTGSTKTLSSNKTNVFSLPNSGFTAKKVEKDATGKVTKTTKYVLSGWYESEAAGAAVHGVGEKWTSDAKPGIVRTLYARFEEAPGAKDTYEIEFIAATADKCTGTAPKAITAKRGTAYTLPSAGSLKKENYVFAGWSYKDISGTTVVKPAGTKVYNLAAKGAKVTATATWTVAPYKITYNLKGGVNDVDNPSTYYFNDTVTLKDAKREGYKFDGWVDKTGAAFKYEKGKTSGAIALTATWTPYSYAVTFNTNGDGGTAPKADLTEYTYDKDALKMPGYTPKDTERTFLGWAKDPKSVKPDYKEKASVKNIIKPTKAKDPVTLYAVLSEKKYGITYDLDGGKSSVTLVNKFTATTAKAGITLPTAAQMTKKGHDFKEWQDADGKKIEKIQITDAAKLAPVTVKATWTDVTETKKWTISFNANGGTGTMDNAEYKDLAADEEVSLPANAFERENYEFKGWATSANGAVVYADKAKVSARKNMPLYAVWAPEEWSVTYDLGGGTFTREQQATYSAGGTITAEDPTLKGHKFAGWKYTGKKADGTDKEETAAHLSDLSGLTGDITFTAEWTANSYDITYDHDNGSFTADTTITAEAATFTYGKESETKLPVKANMTKTGYEFAGWDILNKTTNKKVASKASEIPSGIDSDIKVTAVWDEATYNLTWDGITDATIKDSKGKAFTLPTTFKKSDEGKASLVIPDPVKVGATFDGWKIKIGEGTASPAKKALTLTLSDITGDATITATWTALNAGKIKYVAGVSEGVSGSTADQTVYAGESVELSANGFTRAGYTFAGWSIGENTYKPSKDKYSVSSSLTADQEITATAQWTEWSNAVTFWSNNSSTAADTAVDTHTFKYTDVEADNTYKAPAIGENTKTNYTFKGWATSRTATTATVEAGADFFAAATKAGQKTNYYAVWDEDKYATLTCEVGDGELANVDTETVIKVYDAATDVTLPTLKDRKGYTFKGWSDGAATNTKYYNNTDAKFQFAEIAEDNSTKQTLTATWEPTEYTLTFNVNNATTGTNKENVKYVYGSTFTVLTIENLAKTGYTFKGWGLANDATEIITDWTTVVPESGTTNTVYAVWEPVTITLTFDVNGSTTGSNTTKDYVYGKTFEAPATAGLTKEGYTCIGWALTKDTTTAITDWKTVLPTSGTTNTVYAVWKAE